MIIINGKSYSGSNLTISNNKVIIDGVVVGDDDSKIINIKVEGNINSLIVDNCNKLEIVGDCHNVSSKNGNISIKGNVENNVENKNGNIVAKNIAGNATTKNGNITSF